MTDAFQDLKHKALAGESLTAGEAEQAFGDILSGAIDPIDIAGFVTALKMRGETNAEILGAARVLRRSVDTSLAPMGAIDTCGTGGTGISTLNVSTAVAIVVAACGVPVAKHGNRSVSSKSGSADVLKELGVAAVQPLNAVRQALKEINISFLFAPAFHAAMAAVAPVRTTLKTRTIFNLLGPLANPAGVKRQLVGTYDAQWCLPMVQALRDLGSEKAWVVHGHDGQDELSITGPTYVTEIAAGAIDSFEITPGDADLPTHSMDALRGGDPAFNAAAMRAMLSGEQGAYHDAVALNAAGALLIAGQVTTLKEGAQLASDTIKSGTAASLLKRWAAFTQQYAEKD